MNIIMNIPDINKLTKNKLPPISRPLSNDRKSRTIKRTLSDETHNKTIHRICSDDNNYSAIIYDEPLSKSPSVSSQTSAIIYDEPLSKSPSVSSQSSAIIYDEPLSKSPSVEFVIPDKISILSPPKQNIQTLPIEETKDLSFPFNNSIKRRHSTSSDMSIQVNNIDIQNRRNSIPINIGYDDIPSPPKYMLNNKIKSPNRIRRLEKISVHKSPNINIRYNYNRRRSISNPATPNRYMNSPYKTFSNPTTPIRSKKSKPPIPNKNNNFDNLVNELENNDSVKIYDTPTINNIIRRYSEDNMSSSSNDS